MEAKKIGPERTNEARMFTLFYLFNRRSSSPDIKWWPQWVKCWTKAQQRGYERSVQQIGHVTVLHFSPTRFRKLFHEWVLGDEDGRGGTINDSKTRKPSRVTFDTGVAIIRNDRGYFNRC